MGSGAFCRVDRVSHDFCDEETFAYKSVDPLKVKCPEDLSTAAMELANEAKVLSNLDHENIIKLRGVCSERFSESFVSGNGGYFLVLDELSETVQDRLETWTRAAKRRNSVLRRTKNSLKNIRKSAAASLSSSSSHHSSVDECQKLYSRIDETVLGVVRGMKYLHSKKIVMRDLKPANIGYETFDSGYGEDLLADSTVKLFDFGMAQMVDECDPSEICGSPRYMAPEVMAQKGYSLSVDVYSFGVILYEMCALKRPFEETYNKYKKANKNTKKERGNSLISDFYKAVKGGLKPTDNLENEVCCPKLRCLIEACWSHDPSKRPTFDTILTILVEIFHPDLFSDDSTSAKGRDYSRRSVSIEFDRNCSFDFLDCEESLADQHSYP